MSWAGLMENWWREVCDLQGDGESGNTAERSRRAVNCGRVDGEKSVVAG